LRPACSRRDDCQSIASQMIAAAIIDDAPFKAGPVVSCSLRPRFSRSFHTSIRRH
jgi:hypothetical protein